jgi:RNA polymerase sigma-70 factor (ECF subfamily)
MKQINLRMLYPYYRRDTFLDIPEDVAALLHELDLIEVAYARRRYRHKAHYSLDIGDGIEKEALYPVSSPAEKYEHNEALAELYAAISSLTDKQAKRIYAHFFLGMSKTEIARAEGVSVFTVWQSIERALISLRKKLEGFDGIGLISR